MEKQNKLSVQFHKHSWKYFEYQSLFEIVNGSNKVSEIHEFGNTPLISAIHNKNGLNGFIDSLPQFEGNMITVNNNGDVGIAFYQPVPFSSTTDVNILKPKFNLTENRALFLITIITKECFRYNFARKWQVSKIKKSKIKLPVDKNGEPDWLFMEKHIQNIKNFQFDETLMIEKPMSSKHPILPTEKKWKSFTYEDIFEIKKGQRLVISKLNSDQIKGNCPFVSSIDKNNGVSHRINVKHNHQKNTITINYNGSVGEVYYQYENFWASDDVNVLYPKFELNPYIAMFLIPLLKKEKYRYNYYRKWIIKKMYETEISLPVNEYNNPDWQFMEDYIKSLPYSSNL